MPWELNDYVFNVLDNIHRSLNSPGLVDLVIPRDPKAFGKCFQTFFEDRMAALAAEDKPLYNSSGKVGTAAMIGKKVRVAA
ncbi:MAG: hypothetical protein V1816_01535 [Pseudomonadota bacterium]